MSRLTLGGIAALLLWIAWCVLVVTAIVPAVRRYVTMWPWLMAYAFSLFPVIVVAMIVTLRLRRSE
jgi:hypothetical protein